MWQPVLGTCIMKVAFPKGRKELAVSQLQVSWRQQAPKAGRGAEESETACKAGIELKKHPLYHTHGETAVITY